MEFSRVQKNDAQVERLKSNMRLKEKKQGGLALVKVCVLLNGSTADTSCLYTSARSVDGAASARPVLRVPGSSKPNRVMGKLQEEGSRLHIELVSETKQTVVVAEIGDNYLRLR